MELRQLEYFVAVAEERHFTRAAGRMRVAQSGLSASIRSLERELGAALFLRSTRSVELTDAGRALLVEAKQALGTVVAAREAVAAVQGLLRGRLAIGMLQCLGLMNLSAALAEFHHAHPDVEIRLRQSDSAEMIAQVRTGDLDLAFVSVPDVRPHGVTLAPLATEPMTLACSAGHPLAERESVTLGELEDQIFVDFYPGCLTRDRTDVALTAAGVHRRVAFEVNDAHSLLDFVAGGLGIAVVPESFRRKRSSATFVRFEDPAPSWTLALATGSGRRLSAAARALLSGRQLGDHTAAAIPTLDPGGEF